MTTTVAADRNPSNTCISDGFTTRRIRHSTMATIEMIFLMLSNNSRED